MAVETPMPKANGLKTVVDTIIAPQAAFASIRTAPTWGWALVVSIILFAIGSYLISPITFHVISTHPETTFGPQWNTYTPDQQQRMLSFTEKITSFNWLFVIVAVPFFSFIGAVVMLIFNALGRGEGTLGKYWAAACNISVAGGLGAVANAIIALARGADSFTTVASLQAAIPNLGWAVPGAGTKLAAALGAITPFTLWTTGLTIAAMLIIGRVPRLQAWLCGSLSIAIAVILAAAFVK
jgi:hypothetical protein